MVLKAWESAVSVGHPKWTIVAPKDTRMAGKVGLRYVWRSSKRLMGVEALYTGC